MNQQAGPLPSDMVAAIHRGHKIEAIKKLRAHFKTGLKQAKYIVDHYSSANGEQTMPDCGVSRSSKLCCG